MGAFSKTYLAAGLGFMLLASGLPRHAEAQTAAELQAQIEAMQAQLQELQRKVAAAEAEAARANANARSAQNTARLSTAAPAPAPEPDYTVKWKGAPQITSKDGDFQFKVRGRVLTDYANVDQDGPITGAPDINATELRQARLGVDGVMFGDFKYRFEMNFADGAEVDDAYLRYTALPADITIGHFKTYNSLEELTSSNYITFMERAAITDAFGLQRQIGIGADMKRERWTLGAGLYGANVDDGAPDEGGTFAARATIAPVLTDDKVLHLGASVRHRNAGDLTPYSYRQRADDFHLTDRFVDTGNIGESDTLWGLEFAGVWGPFSVQSEYMQNKVDAPSFASDPTYDGWYVDTSYFLTGETRPYKEGVFGRVKVKNPVNDGGWGAWQIAGRYDVIDLSEGGCLECGEQDTWLIGLNWYLTNHTRLMLNVAQSEIDGGVNDGADITGVAMRAQVDW
ncbi:OprO/OprP family phosphate-selective porin [Methyloligella sp. 2.7D]|uniref:OprO/OprP family phosphate-selective porin n=1 Tax=unclassified Methyloligella TaxID=2625955 RepID=UPI00157E17B6|nr:OprO/OprP family phosphate-selective porin [Methyloligella sp. GL2]QKP76651.1 OprO/OprP family phosphate-selective porin [Methyloligella sp. GL2]